MKCELISSLGDDLTVVNSARVSFENESRWQRNIPALGITLLNINTLHRSHIVLLQ